MFAHVGHFNTFLLRPLALNGALERGSLCLSVPLESTGASVSLSGCTHRISPNKVQDGAETGCVSSSVFTLALCHSSNVVHLEHLENIGAFVFLNLHISSSLSLSLFCSQSLTNMGLLGALIPFIGLQLGFTVLSEEHACECHNTLLPETYKTFQ